MAYASWSVVFGEQPSAAKWNILGTNDASFADGSGISPASFIVSSSNLGSRSQALTASGSGTIAYSTNNPTMTLAPGTYLLVAQATVRAAISSQDSSFMAVIYNDTTSSETVANGTASTGGSVTIYPTFSVHAIVTPAVNTTYSSRASQTFGTGTTYLFVSTTLIAIPLKTVHA